MDSQFDSSKPSTNQPGQANQESDTNQTSQVNPTRSSAAQMRPAQATELEQANQSSFDSFASEHKKGLIFFASVVICLFCLLGVLSPDGRTFEKEFRNDIKNGTQVKDVVSYFKERNLAWTWERSNRQLTVVLPGRNWIPFVKVDYKELVFFDNFNRLKGRSGSMEYKFFRQ
ncbi:MAG: hypothetical protein P4L53_03440 [Candidatus Obscuribacterales bacterium]|nr:hypothetical protein [Candidatus Obscuribacterales bacterium]